MTVGLCRVRLHLPENHSLKGKRQVIKSLVTRIHNRFNVSVAEIDEHDRWQMASIGISCVSTSSQHAHQVLSNVVGFIQRERTDAELVDYEIEIIQALGQ
ncbi:MAG: DUF503 domain-containing protein [Dehalococcoidia bacterium]